MINKLLIKVDTEAPKPFCNVLHEKGFVWPTEANGAAEMLKKDLYTLLKTLTEQIDSAAKEGFLNKDETVNNILDYFSNSISSFDIAQKIPDFIAKYDETNPSEIRRLEKELQEKKLKETGQLSGIIKH